MISAVQHIVDVLEPGVVVDRFEMVSGAVIDSVRHIRPEWVMIEE